MSDDPKSWYRDGYMISTAQQLIQLNAVNEAMGSDVMYWAKKMEREALKKMLDKSLCFGLYELPEVSLQVASKLPSCFSLHIPSHLISTWFHLRLTSTGREGPPQIGFARLITDEVSFAYLTDVYVLPSHQGKGLGKWILQCVTQELSTWPDLRRSIFMTHEGAIEFYRKTMDHMPFEQGKGGSYLLNKKWAGSVAMEA